jgi:putative nucleotidyltransferase with HDIG domain
MTNTNVTALAKSITDAMTISTTAQRVVRLANDINCSPKDLEKAISQDPVMAGKLVKMANSSFFGFVAKVANIGNAVTRLGLKRTRNLALSFGIGNLIEPDETEDDRSYSRINVWKHSVAAAVLCDTLMKHSTSSKIRAFSDEAFLVGLVHDIGVILADQHMPAKYKGVPESVDFHDTTLLRAERQFLGFTHPELGAEVLKNWKFPPHIVAAIAHHHNAGQHMEEPLSLLAAAAEYVLANPEYPGFADLPPSVSGKGMGDVKYRLDIMGESFDNAMNDFEGNVQEVLDIFGK